MVHGMSVQPVTGSLRAAARLAGVGLATVLVFLGVFAVWSSNRSVDAASQLKRSQLVSSAYASARFALDDERLREHQYMLGHGGSYASAATPGLHAQFDSLSNQATTALLALERLGDPSDRQLAARLLGTQRAYHAATDRIFAAAMMGNQSMAQMHGSTADRSFNQLNVELAEATDARSSDALAQLNSLQRTEGAISRVTVVAVPLALLLVVAFWPVLRGYRRRVEHQRSEARLSSLVQNASDVICIVGEDADFRYVSPSVQRMFGYSPSALADGRLLDVVHPDDRRRVLAFLGAISTQPADRPHTAEFRVRQREQGWSDVEALGTNLLADEAIHGIVLNVRDVTERKAFEAELEHQAFHDTLTGLPNRALFRNRVEHALAGQRRDSLPVAVLFLDIDDFKDVNDSLGHAAGDEVLQEVGRRLDGCMRAVDTAARLGGDEFAVLIDGSESEMQAIEIAHRVMDALAVTLPLDGKQVTIAPSIGIAFSGEKGSAGRDAEELLRDADAAMYMAKEAGKGGYQVFQPDMHAQALARLELKADLQRAMDAGEFTVRYQPYMDLSRGDMAGMEALARWEHPVRGTVSPTEFIPLAEATGLIVPLGHQILKEACGQAALMQRECPRDPPLSISVNVSAFQLQRAQFVDEVRDVLAETGLAPSSLILELTESVMMRDTDLSISRMNALRSLGIRLAIDDFGTGYSSLGYLRRFPVDILKIDRSFLADPSDQVTQLTAAVVELARIFELRAVVEGIEDETHLERLKDMSPDFGQGFHFAKPLSGEELASFAAQTHAAPNAASAPQLVAGSPAATGTS
jgi:diguanylate cyclase (GGDEF)-like protein/PAS domain S-box-containing protein